MRKISGETSKKEEEFLFFFFFGVIFKSTVSWEEKLLFSRWNWTRLKARELQQQTEMTERKRNRQTEVGERRLMAASAAKRERRLKEIFSAEGHCSAEGDGRDEVGTLDATRQALINAFHLLLNQLCLLLAFTPRSLRSCSSRPMTPTVNRHNKVQLPGISDCGKQQICDKKLQMGI